MCAILGINACIITDLSTPILWLLQLNNCNESYKHADMYLLPLSYSWVRKHRRCSLTHVHTGRLVLPSMSVCPHSPCSPPTLSRLWHWPACGKAETFPSSDCSILACHNGRETFLLHLYSPRAAALLQEQRGREGVSSTPLLSSPAKKRVSSCHITQEACCSTLHLLSLYFTYQWRGTVEIWCWAGSSVTTIQGSLMPFPCSASSIGKVRPPQLLFSKWAAASCG